MRIRFYTTASGRSPVEEFLANCSEGLRLDFFDAIALLAAGKVLSMPLSRNLSSIYAGLHELRLKNGAGQIRVFYFVERGDAIYLLHAFKKKTQELPAKETNLVLKRIREV